MKKRKIKFRAWDKMIQKMIGVKFLEYLCVGDDVVVSVIYKPDKMGGYEPKKCEQLTNYEVENLVIMQYTGIKDSHGEEIYEGDIIRSWSDKHKGESIFVMEHESYGNGAGFHIHGDPYWEIIGNIYENPELINNERGHEKSKI